MSSARRISTRWRSPTERLDTGALGVDLEPVVGGDPHEPPRPSVARDSVPSRPSQTFSATVRASNSAKCWNTIAIPIARACRGLAMVTGAPFQAMRPSSGRTAP